MSNQSDNLRGYELLAIIAGSLKDSDMKKELSKWEKSLQEIGKILHQTTWDRRTLAYKIKQETTGTYLICHFSANPDKIPEFQKLLQIDSKVIRFFICATDKNYTWQEYTAENLESDPRKFLQEKNDSSKKNGKKNDNRKFKDKDNSKEKKSTSPKAKETISPKSKKVTIDSAELDQAVDSALKNFS